MNAIYFNRGFAAKFFAVVALFSLIAGLVPMQAFAAPTKVFNATVNPGSINAGATTHFDFTITNDGSSDANIKAARIVIPAGFSGSNLTVSNSQFEVNFVGTEIRISLKPGTGNDGLVPGASMIVGVDLTNNSGSGNSAWQVCAYKNNSFTPAGGADFSFVGGGDCASLSVNIVTLPVPGCTNPLATNYNPLATQDDGSCIVVTPVPGCTNPSALNYNPSATVDNGSCILPVPGCMDPLANNYNPAANVNDGSCTYDVRGCTNPAASNYNPAANIDDGSCIVPVTGCTNPDATNYNPAATVDDGSCILPVPGCTDDTANNYDPDATVNDGSCTYDVLGCTNPLASNFNPLANVDDGSCVITPPPVLGCTNPLAINYNPAATQDDGSCILTPPPVLGCTNPDATNYNPLATQDDGSCDFGGGGGPDPIPGCTDRTATNFNPNATVSDQSCIYNYVSQCNDTPNLLTNGSFEQDHGLTAGNWGIFTPVLGWAISNDGLEIWNNLLITPSDGAQNAELDGNSPSTISQTVATIPGATYEFRFDFAARSDASSAADNHIEATVDGNSLVNQSTTNTNWTTYGGTFTADGSTDVALADLGTANSVGTLIDNAVLCLVRIPDDNDNDELSCTLTANDTDIRRGSDVTLNWSSTDAVYAELDGEEVDLTDSKLIQNLRADTTYTLTVWGQNEDSETCNVTVNTRGGGGGGGGGGNNNDPEPEVLGESTPEPLVLGEQVDAVPLGAANTGAGATSPLVLNYFNLVPVALLRRTRVHG